MGLEASADAEALLRALDEMVAGELAPALDEGVSLARAMLRSSGEPFGWHFLPEPALGWPPPIRSAAVFVLAAGVAPEPHHHPNSVQHMRALSGTARMTLSDGAASETAEVTQARPWVVIPTGVTHAFVVGEAEPFAVVSFHTAAHDEIEEVTDRGARRYG